MLIDLFLKHATSRDWYFKQSPLKSKKKRAKKLTKTNPKLHASGNEFPFLDVEEN